MTMLTSSTLESHLARTVSRTGTWKDRLTQSCQPGALGAIVRRMVRPVAQSLDFAARAVFHLVRNRQYLTATKLVNMGLVQVQCLLKTERVVGMPYRMKIEPTNICNTQCQLCPTGLKIKGRAYGKMDLTAFESLVTQLKRYLYTLDLSMWGDPLICPDIYRMIRFAHQAGIWTYISSNLHAYKLGQGQAEELVRSGLDMLTCSLHGATQASYEAYQPGKKLQTSIEKIREIVETRRRLGSATPVIQLNFVVTRFNEHEIEAFRSLAAELSCKPVFSNPSLNLRFLGQDKNLVDLKLAPDILAGRICDQLDRWLPQQSEYIIEPYRLIRDGRYRSEDYNGRKAMGCQWPWKDAVVNWDGSVVTCCGVFDPRQDMGNALRTRFSDIWNGPKYRAARRSFRRPIDDSDNPCRDCPGFMI